MWFLFMKNLECLMTRKKKTLVKCILMFTHRMRRCRGFSVYIDLRSEPLFQNPSPTAPSLEPLGNAVSSLGETLMGFGKSLKGVGCDRPDFETTFGKIVSSKLERIFASDFQHFIRKTCAKYSDGTQQ